MAIDLSRKPKNALTPAPMRRSPFARVRRAGQVQWGWLPGVLWRRKGFLLGCVALALGVALAYLSGVTPQYQARALVLLEGGASPGADLPGVAAAVGQEPQSEALLVRSRDMAERLVDRLNLQMLPEFNPALAPARPGLLDRYNPFELLPSAVVHRVPDAWVEGLLTPPRGPELTDLERADLLRQRIVGAVAARIDAAAQDNTTVLRLGFRSADPELSAMAANALAELYLEDRAGRKRAIIERTAEFLAREIQRLQESVRQAEAAIQDHRERNGLIEPGEADPAQLSQLTTELVLARNERTTAEARLRQAARLMGATAGVQTAATDLLDSPLIDDLRARKAELDRRKAEAMGRTGPGSPEVVALETEEAALNQRLREEGERLMQALRGEVQDALAREAGLQAQLTDLKSELNATGGATGELRSLQRQAEADRALLETYLTRAVELRARQTDDPTAARVVAHATAPGEPAFPRRNLVVGAAIGAALLLGTLIAVGLERMDDTFRSGQQIEEAMAVPSLGLIPALSDAEHQGDGPELYVLRKPNSRFGEAVRSLRTALLLPRGTNPPPRVILFTSSVPDEGKTSMAVSLARMHARAGRETLIVDCDLRRPRLHESCGVENQLGLSDLLKGSHTLDRVMQIEEVSGASFITAGAPVSDPTALLGSDRMKRLLEDLSRRFELIVLDSPPVLSVSDARVLAQLADATVFLIRWGHTRRHDAMTGVRLLQESGAKLAGAALTRVNARKHARYGYRDSGYFHAKRYTTYYSE